MKVVLQGKNIERASTQGKSLLKDTFQGAEITLILPPGP